MNINIKTTGIELTDALSEYVHEKMRSVEKFLPGGEGENAIVQVEIGKTTKHHQAGVVFRAEANINAHGARFRAVSEKEDLYAAIDDMKDELAREMKSAKEKKKTLMRRGGAAIKRFLRRSKE
ncbi:MAG: ribosome hibernation-promoting factor, HPF/YfiA family [Minisyncoccota bacterium]